MSSNTSRSSPAATEISNAGYSSTGRTSEHCNTAQILQQLHKNGNGAPSPFESNIMNTNTLVTPPLNVGVENSQLDSHPYVSHPMLPSTGNVNVSAYIAGLRYGLAMSSKQQQQPANDIDEPAAMASVSLNNVMENNELLFMNSSVGAKNNDLMKQPLQCFPVGTGNPAMESLATLAPFAIGTSFTTEDGSSPYRTAPPTTHRGKKIKMCRMESCMTPAAKRTPYCAQHMDHVVVNMEVVKRVLKEGLVSASLMEVVVAVSTPSVIREHETVSFAPHMVVVSDALSRIAVRVQLEVQICVQHMEVESVVNIKAVQRVHSLPLLFV